MMSARPRNPRDRRSRRAAPPVRSKRYQRLRLPVVQQGEETYPHVLGIDERGVIAYHHGTGQEVPAPWRDLVRGGAEFYGISDEEFLAYLRRIVSETISGPSAPTRSDAHAGSTDRGPGPA